MDILVELAAEVSVTEQHSPVGYFNGRRPDDGDQRRYWPRRSPLWNKPRYGGPGSR